MDARQRLKGITGQQLRPLGGLRAQRLAPAKKGSDRQFKIGPVPLLAWWDPADVGTPTPPAFASELTEWKDKVGGRVVNTTHGGTQSAIPGLVVDNYHSAGSNCPIFQAHNGRGLSSPAAHGIAGVYDETWVFAVAQSNGAAGGVFAYGHGAAPTMSGWSSKGRGVSFNYSGAQWPIAHRDSAYYQQGMGADSLIVMAGRFRYVGGTEHRVELWFDGEYKGETASNLAGDDFSAFGIHMSARELAGGCFFLGDCIVTPALTVFERQYLEGYLHWKYARANRLASDHPYRNARPS